MTNENLEKIKERIQKLLNMTAEKGCTEAEAQTAMEMAQVLLIKYNLEMEEVMAHQDEKDLAIEMCREFYAVAGNFNWHKYLACYIAKHNMCHGVIKGYKRQVFGSILEDTGYGVYVFGRRANVQATKIMVEWISIQLEYLATVATRDYNPYADLPGYVRQILEEVGEKIFQRRHKGYVVSKQQFRNSFLWGAINRVNERLYASRETFLDNNPNTKTLVLDRDAEVKKYQEQVMSTVKHHAGQNLDSNGYGAGRRAGDIITFGGSSHIGNQNHLRLGNGN